MKKILIMHETVAKHDAIGNDIEIMYQILKQHYECVVYAVNQFNKNVEYVSEDELEKYLEDEEAIIIFHHSVNWEKGVDYLYKAKGKKIIRYHNITPPEFFEPYNEWHYSQCLKGRQLTVEIAEKLKNAIWMCDSEYNAKDIEEYVDAERICVCPPFNKLDEWENIQPHEQTLQSLIYDNRKTLLFVGRIVPNKGILYLLKVLFIYVNNFDHNIVLRIVGKFDEGLPKFNKLIRDTIQKYQLTNNVEFIGEINDSILMSYYLGSDLFVCASEHEGFCVPIIEAQYFELPIVARKLCAVPETIGENQVLLEDKPELFAGAVRILLLNQMYQEYLTKVGKENLMRRYSCKRISELFMEYIDEE